MTIFLPQKMRTAQCSETDLFMFWTVMRFSVFEMVEFVLKLHIVNWGPTTNLEKQNFKGFLVPTPSGSWGALPLRTPRQVLMN